ncbi:MAG: glycosyltransferase [Prosthecobacter sp.]|nr:glycosyltransferase [Prosthecobacter sp.]
MRVLFVSNLFPDTTQPWRGLDNVTLLQAMRALRPEANIRVLCLRPGHRFWLGGACPLQPRPGDEGFLPTYHWAPYLPRFGGLNDRFFKLALRRALKSLPADWQPDALLVPWLFPDASGVHRCQEMHRVPMVAVAQGSDVHRYLEMPLRRRAILKLATRAEIVTRSEDLRQRLIKAGAKAASVHTVYNGVHTDIFHPGDKSAARRALNLPEEGRMALFVGNFLPVKGLDLLIQACALAKSRLSQPFHLVLIGSGPLEAELVTLAETCGLGRDHLILAGRKAPADVAQFMRAADAVCLSSHNEGVPNVLLEALASGRPLVSTNVGGIAEILNPSPGGGVLLSDRSPSHYAEGLLQALTNPPDPQLLSACAAQYSWERCASIYWGFLDSAPSSAINARL